MPTPPGPAAAVPPPPPPPPLGSACATHCGSTSRNGFGAAAVTTMTQSGRLRLSRTCVMSWRRHRCPELGTVASWCTMSLRAAAHGGIRKGYSRNSACVVDKRRRGRMPENPLTAVARSSATRICDGGGWGILGGWEVSAATPIVGQIKHVPCEPSWICDYGVPARRVPPARRARRRRRRQQRQP